MNTINAWKSNNHLTFTPLKKSTWGTDAAGGEVRLLQEGASVPRKRLHPPARQRCTLVCGKVPFLGTNS